MLGFVNKVRKYLMIFFTIKIFYIFTKKTNLYYEKNEYNDTQYVQNLDEYE